MATNQPSSFNDPGHWRKRAMDMRRVADEMEPLPVAKASLLRIADGYEQLAARLTERLTTK
jgi:hypothetical protein